MFQDVTYVTYLNMIFLDILFIPPIQLSYWHLLYMAAEASKQLHTFILHYNLALVDTATKFLMLFPNITL